MSHFRLNKKAKHFRTLKGWKKELEEVSITFLVVVLIVVGFGANIARAQGPGITFWGQVVSVQPCGTPVDGPPPCQVLIIPNVLVEMIGPIPRLDINPLASKSGMPPRPGGWIIGFAAPPLATMYWAY